MSDVKPSDLVKETMVTFLTLAATLGLLIIYCTIFIVQSLWYAGSYCVKMAKGHT